MSDKPFIEHLRNNQGQADMDGVIVTVSRQAIDETLAYVAELENPWIPTSERLPEAGETVALLDMNRHTVIDRDKPQIMDIGSLSVGFGSDHWTVSGCRAKTLESYSHWAPLPPLPQGK